MQFIRPLMIVGIAAGCGGGGGYNGMTTSVYTALTLGSSSVSAYQFSGTPTTMQLTARDQNNAAMSTGGAAPVWHVTPSGIATVNGAGRLVVTSATPTLLTISADLTIGGVMHNSNAVQVQTDLAPALEQVTTVGTSYSPATVDIKAGGTVSWSGLAANHNVDFSSATPFGGNAKNGLPGSSNSATGTFLAAGSYPYQCDVHGPAMSGTVVVH